MSRKQAPKPKKGSRSHITFSRSKSRSRGKGKLRGSSSTSAGSKRHRKVPKQPADKQVPKKRQKAVTAESRDQPPVHSLYREGIYLGGEALVEKWMPDGMLLPDVTCEEIIQAGLKYYRSHMLQLAGTSEIKDLLWTAIVEKRPISLVRLGDGELLSLAYDTVMSPAEVYELGAFLPYAGVPVPDAFVQRSLIDAMKGADYIGVPVSRKPAFQMLMFRLFKHYQLPIREMRLTTSTINFSLYHTGYLIPLLYGRRVLLIGNRAVSTAQVLRGKGINVIGTIYPVSGFSDIDQVLASCSEYEYDIALVAAGVPAVVICQRIASMYGKVAIDIGHVADEMIKNEATPG
ncbi:GT-D fold domain-containing protein [Paenibacillus sp. Marseille-Q7038]